MKIHELSPAEGARQRKKRVGRGPGSGHGKTCCRGHKGQKARSGGGPAPGFEGGQMPLHRRLPKRGFTNIFRAEYATVNVRDLECFEANAVIDVDALRQAGLIKRLKDGVKLLGSGEIDKPLTVKVHKASISARHKIESAGGKVVLV